MPFIPNQKIEKEGCHSSEHTPPTYMVFPSSGKWVCPHCGQETYITVL